MKTKLKDSNPNPALDQEFHDEHQKIIQLLPAFGRFKIEMNQSKFCIPGRKQNIH